MHIRPHDKTTDRIRGTTPEVTAAARDLRAKLTPAEQVLWGALQRRQLHGLKFRCQHPVGPLVLDFYCPEHKLVIEVDGPIHDSQGEQDEARTQHLAAYGYRVLRFRNDEVLNALGSVSARIAEAALNPPASQL